MTDHHNTTVDAIKAFVSYVAALLGIGTFAGLVNIGVGVLSAVWLAVQLWNWWTFTRLMNKAKLAAALRGEFTKPGDV